MISDFRGPGSRLSGDDHTLTPRSHGRSTRAVSRAPASNRARSTRRSGGRPERERQGAGSQRRCRRGAPMPRGLPQRPQTRRPERLRSAFTAQLPQSGHAIAPSPTAWISHQSCATAWPAADVAAEEQPVTGRARAPRPRQALKARPRPTIWSKRGSNGDQRGIKGGSKTAPIDQGVRTNREGSGKTPTNKGATRGTPVPSQGLALCVRESRSPPAARWCSRSPLLLLASGRTA